jgi:hypothetical protein
MSLLCQMDPNLMLPTGFKLHLGQGKILGPFENSDMGYRSFPFGSVSRRITSMHAIFGKVGLDGLFIVSHLTFRNRHVGPACAVFLELILQMPLRNFRLCKDQQT